MNLEFMAKIMGNDMDKNEWLVVTINEGTIRTINLETYNKLTAYERDINSVLSELQCQQENV